MANATSTPFPSWNVTSDDTDTLINDMRSASTVLSDPVNTVPLLSETFPSSTVMPTIGEDVAGCFAHKDFQQLLGAMECRFVLGLFMGTVIATCVLLIVAFVLLCCFLLCRLRRKRKMRRNLTVRSDSMLDLALPKKLSPPGVVPPRATIQELHIPRVARRISAYGPPNEEIYASEVPHRSLGTTNGTTNGQRFSSFSPYVPPSYGKTYRIAGGPPEETYPLGVMQPTMASIYAPPDLFAEQNRRAFLNYSSHVAQPKTSEDNDYDATPRRPSSQYGPRNSMHFGEADVVFRNHSGSTTDGEFRNTRC
ncbi:hypothetical protein QR680_005431 [Steinernema hermaphroditum]|uniref:Uncharacterized protein n=1 Tax=Steinernema hermaphroditum TaxID=289476 RepID=A0AA39HTF4_9BILA|nr:hypothetical protein QR680_005431 [Steinernema hermaphroditum]